MLRRLLDRELGVIKHNDRLGRPPQRIYLLQRPIRPGTLDGPKSVPYRPSYPHQPVDAASYPHQPADTARCRGVTLYLSF